MLVASLSAGTVMTVCKLDKTRHYGMIFGDMGGARFEQDGKLFDATESELNASSPVESFSPTGGRSVIIEPPKKRGRPPKK